MNEELKKEYRDTFSEIHAPEALVGKVRDMVKKENVKMGMSFVKKLAVTTAAAAVLFVGSNGVAYAATGSTWVETVVIHFNGSGYDAGVNGEVGEDAVTYSVDENVDMEGIEIDLTEELPFTVEEYNVTTE